MKRFFRIKDFRPDPGLDVEEELLTHVDLMVEDLMARGMSEEEALVRARQALGAAGRKDDDGSGQPPRQGTPESSPSWALAREGAAAHTRSRLRRRSLADGLDSLVRDVRYALRRLARAPGFTVIAILSLAIGIGANTAVFSVVNAFLIRKPPFKNPEELVRVYSSIPQRSPFMTSSYPDYLDLREMDDVFVAVGAWENTIAAARLGDESMRITVEAVTSGLLPMVGVDPVLGRSFLPEEDLNPGERPVAILGHRFWQQAFGGSPDVLGRSITVSGRPFSVVGVAPEWYSSLDFGGLSVDLIIPLSMSAAVDGSSEEIYRERRNSRLEIMARLAPGVERVEAQARMSVLAARLDESYPESARSRTFRIIPNEQIDLAPELDQGMRLTAGFLLVVVGLVLLLACTNLASLLLAKGIDRQKEVAMRLALGAPRGRLIRQLLTETLLLGFLGGVAGLAIARLTTAFLMGYQPPLPVPLSLELGFDRRVLLFTAGITTLAGVLFGLAPALRSTRPDLTPTLKGLGGPGARKRLTLQTVLVAFQMAVSVILLVGGGLFLRSLMAAQRLNPGFSTEEAGIAWIDLQPSRMTAAERGALQQELEDRLRSQPGIQEVASASRLPLSIGTDAGTFRIPGVESPSGQEAFRVDLTSVSPEFFRVMEIPILAGRPFTTQDRMGAPDVAVVSQEMVRRLWPGEDAVGKEIYSEAHSRPITVVGVARDTKVHTLGEAPLPAVYLSSAQRIPSDLQIIIRGNLGSGEMLGTLRRVIREADPGLVVMEVKSMEDHMALHLFGPRVAGILLGTFGVLALLLSSIGLYGVVSFSVSRRTREMGVRISLGAGSGNVIRTVVGQSMAVVAGGAVVGLVLSLLLARVIRVLLIGISPADPMTLAGIPLLLGGVAFLAALIPARRATRVNPVEALRTE